MSQLELIAELRGARLSAPPSLRTRVREIAAQRPQPPRFRVPAFSVRRAFVLAPAGVAVAAAAALVVGLATPGAPSPKYAAVGTVERVPVPPRPVFVPAQDAATNNNGGAPSTGSGTAGALHTASGGGLPVTRGRAQNYQAEFTLRVKDLSRMTKRALSLTRSFGGYVRSVDYGSGSKSGTAYLVVRVPIGSVQAAIVRFSALGAILDQHVSIQDVQPQLDARFKQMQALGVQIAALLKAGKSADAQVLQGRLASLLKAQSNVKRQTSFATVSLELTSKQAAVVPPPPHHPGRLERGLDRVGSILSTELIVLLYVLIVGVPLAIVAALTLGAARLQRRRAEERLLSGTARS